MDNFEDNRSLDEYFNEIIIAGYDCNKISFQVEKEEYVNELILSYLISTSSILEREISDNPNLLKDCEFKEIIQKVEKNLNEALKKEAKSRKIKYGEGSLLHSKKFMNALESSIKGGTQIYRERTTLMIDLCNAVIGTTDKELKEKGYVFFHKDSRQLKSVIKNEGNGRYAWYDIYFSDMYAVTKMRLLSQIKGAILKTGKIIDENKGYN